MAEVIGGLSHQKITQSQTSLLEKESGSYQNLF